jgi:hypothetical protein
MLDVFAPELDVHRRGWIVLPYDTAGGDKAGDVVPGWVCCLCGKASTSRYLIDIDHGCCVSSLPRCPDRGAAPGWLAQIEAAWTAVLPGGVA